jgi:hypothetical protein
MRTCLLAILSLCFCLTVVVALSQEAPNQTPRKTQVTAWDRLTTINGTVQEGGHKLRFATEQRMWNVENPEILEGHEGHFVHAKVYVYPDKNLIHITEVMIPTAHKTMEADIK